MSTPWSEAERALIRRYLGFPALFHQFEPRLENALTAVQANDQPGGVLPTDDTQTDMRNAMTQLAFIDTQRQTLLPLLFVKSAGSNNAQIIPGVALWDLEDQGRKYINLLSIPLGTIPIRDYYTGEKLVDTDSYGGNSIFPTDLG